MTDVMVAKAAWRGPPMSRKSQTYRDHSIQDKRALEVLLRLSDDEDELRLQIMCVVTA